jgi:16S rRNA (uracil1498-N3)-methyltransferase
LRAFYLKNLTPHESYALKGDEAHHLINVVRLQLAEPLLLLNGQGLLVWTTVDFISRKELVLKYSRHEQRDQKAPLDLALGIPKKDALELSLKEAVELGFGTIFLVRGDFSQIKIPETDRIEAILISALEQSNSAFLPHIISIDWEEIPFQNYSEICWMNSKPGPQKLISKTNSRKLLIVGPEGGFSPKEVEFFQKMENLCSIHLPTPILRTPTAIAAGAGFLLGRLLNQDNYDKL